ncbi:unnamed protein product [Lampetra planeri]
MGQGVAQRGEDLKPGGGAGRGWNGGTSGTPILAMIGVGAGGVGAGAARGPVGKTSRAATPFLPLSCSNRDEIRRNPRRHRFRFHFFPAFHEK